MSKLITMFFLFLLIISEKTFAYLDPATGNVLVYLVVALVGALFYSLKGAYYFVLRKFGLSTKIQEANDYSKIIVFCEGKMYWNTFKPIVEALIAKEVSFSYYTTDIEDPGLLNRNPLMFGQYLGDGSAAYARLCRVEGDLLLATTPNIGTKGYPLPRPPKIQQLIHVTHAVEDCAYYHRESLNNYDEVIMVGDYMIPSLRKLEQFYKCKPKNLISLGLPYLDVMAEKIPSPLPKIDNKTVLLAPSWGSKSFLAVYGSDFICDLAKENVSIIIRPHPYSWQVEKKELETLQKKLSCFDNISWDTDPDGVNSMLKATVLVSDVSAVRFDFALLFERPVVTLEIPMENSDEYERSILDSPLWLEVMEEKIGTKIRKNEKEKIVSTIKNLMSSNEKNNELKKLKNDVLTNFMHTGEKIADYLILKSKNDSNKEKVNESLL